MLPSLTAEGMLPAGVHPAPLDEIIAVFGSTNAVRRDIA